MRHENVDAVQPLAGLDFLAHKVAAFVVLWRVRQLYRRSVVPLRSVRAAHTCDEKWTDAHRSAVPDVEEIQRWRGAACVPVGDPIELFVVAFDPVKRSR